MTPHAISNCPHFRNRPWLYAFASLVLLTACGKDPHAENRQLPGLHDDLTSYAGLAFVTSDTTRSSSQVLYNSFSEARLTEVLTGESGDAVLYQLGSDIFLFNRLETNLNFRNITPHLSGGTLPPQIKTPGGAFGPSAALLLGPDRVLLSNSSLGSLVLMKPSDGSVLQTISAAWDLGTSDKASFMPGELYKHTTLGGGTEVYVIHTGLGSDFKRDGSQAVFVLADDGQTLTPVDLDSNTPKLQGIKLRLANPQGFYAGTSTDSPLLAGICTAFDTLPCTSGFERIDLANRTTDMIYDITDQSFQSNGAIIETSPGVFYTNTGEQAAGHQYRNHIRRFSVTDQTHSLLYTMSSASGSHALTYDQSRDKLYVGDQTPDGGGVFKVYDLKDPSAEPMTLPLNDAPNSAVMVPK